MFVSVKKQKNARFSVGAALAAIGRLRIPQAWSAGIGPIAAKAAPTSRFSSFGVKSNSMTVSVKYTFSPVYERAFPLPAPHEDSSTAHRGHGPLVHKHRGCFIIRGSFRRHES